MRRNSGIRGVLAAAIVLFSGAGALAQDASPAAVPAAASITVQVSGQVKTAGTFAVPAGSRVSDALALAGLHPFAELPKNVRLVDALPAMATCPGDADLHRVFLRRQIGDAPAVQYMFDFLKSRDDSRFDPVLRDKDRVFVPTCMWFKPIQVSPLDSAAR